MRSSVQTINSPSSDSLQQMLMEKVRGKRILYIKQITATMAVNTGPGLVGVLAFKEP